jgi:hypothetical protein
LKSALKKTRDAKSSESVNDVIERNVIIDDLYQKIHHDFHHHPLHHDLNTDPIPNSIDNLRKNSSGHQATDFLKSSPQLNIQTTSPKDAILEEHPDKPFKAKLKHFETNSLQKNQTGKCQSPVGQDADVGTDSVAGDTDVADDVKGITDSIKGVADGVECIADADEDAADVAKGVATMTGRASPPRVSTLRTIPRSPSYQNSIRRHSPPSPSSSLLPSPLPAPSALLSPPPLPLPSPLTLSCPPVPPCSLFQLLPSSPNVATKTLGTLRVTLKMSEMCLFLPKQSIRQHVGFTYPELNWPESLNGLS